MTPPVPDHDDPGPPDPPTPGADAPVGLDDAARLDDGTPRAHVAGRTAFLGIELLVAPGALVPRRETELLARTAVDVLTSGDVGRRGADAPRVADLCCGIGNVGCAVAVRTPRARVFMSDLTAPCVDQAAANVAHLGLDERVSVHRGDLTAAYEGLGLEGTLDVVVANPPYISSGRLDEGDRSALLDHEPRAAFDGGPYGLTIHQRLIREAPALLVDGGTLLFEFGVGQERQVELLFRRARELEGLRFVADDDGRPRVAVATRTPRRPETEEPADRARP